jgi:hypothetical protein
VKQFLHAFGLALLLAVPAGAADLHAVLAVPRQRVETANFRVSGRLVSVDSKGDRTTLPLTIEALGSAKVLHVLISTGKPRRSHILLEMRTNGEISIWIAHPGDKAPAVLPFAQWSDGPLGSGFSYEDFLDQQYFWPDQSVAEETHYGSRICDVLQSSPGPASHTHYASIRTWLDHTIGFPVYAEKTLKSAVTVKEFTYLSLRHDGGVWSAKQVEEKSRGQAGSTLLIIDRGTAKANLQPGNFIPGKLVRFQD